MGHPATHRTNDHRGILYLLDSAGRTIEELEHRAAYLEAQVEEYGAVIADLRRQLEEVRTGAAATGDVPPEGTPAPDDGPHDPHAPPP